MRLFIERLLADDIKTLLVFCEFTAVLIVLVADRLFRITVVQLVAAIVVKTTLCTVVAAPRVTVCMAVAAPRVTDTGATED